MKKYLANAGWGVLDYVAYPLGMLVVAPVILRNMGAAPYGVWTVTAAAISTGSIIASGFADANIQQVAEQRGRSQHQELIQIVRCMIGIHLVLATALGLLMWILAPHLAGRVVPATGKLRNDCRLSLELAAALLWVRTMESVCISTQRAFVRYGAAVRVSLLARLLSLVAAAALTFIVKSLAAMFSLALLFNLLATARQFVQLRRLLGGGSLLPLFHRATLKALIGFGGFSWLQAIAGIVFSQVDRLFLGVSVGAVAVAGYALCTQMAQPIYGIVASGLHFLFPYLAERRASRSLPDLRMAVFTSFLWNLLFVTVSSFALLFVGPATLRMLAGDRVATDAAPLLPIIVAGTAMFAICVPATYSLYAFGRIRIVTAISLAAGAVMFLLMVHLTPRLAAAGPAYARLSYGFLMLGLYVPLAREWKRGRSAAISIPTADAIGEGI